MSEWLDSGKDQMADLLSGLYQTEQDIRTVLKIAGIPTGMIAFDGKAFNTWTDAITVAINLNRLSTLIDVVARQYENMEADLKILYSRYMFLAARETGKYSCAEHKRTRNWTPITRGCLARGGAPDRLDRRKPEVESTRPYQPDTQRRKTPRPNGTGDRQTIGTL